MTERYAADRPAALLHTLAAPTKPTFDYRACITERVWVETPVDTDGDGMADLIAVYVRRPRETAEGLVVPAVYVADPYMLGCDDDGYTPHNTDVELRAFEDGTAADARFRIDRDGQIADGECTAAQSATQSATQSASHATHSPSPSNTDDSPASSASPARRRSVNGHADAQPCTFPELECISDYYAFYNSCGYATIFAGGLGTRGSQGFNDCGSPEETAAFAAVIDWLNGRARAFTNPTDGIEVTAGWASGKVAMTGKSYLGTMCVAVAAAGVDGLATILPVAGISDWYDYYRCNGLVRPALGWQGDDIDLLAEYCFSRVRDTPSDAIRERFAQHLANVRTHMDRESGNYNSWWHERNYLAHLCAQPCPAFIVQGLDDMNVKPSQAVRLARALRRRGTRTALVLHRGAHCYAHDLDGNLVNDLAHRWLDHHLVDPSVDISDVPAVLVQDDCDQDRWISLDAFPTFPRTLVGQATRTDRDAEDPSLASVSLRFAPNDDVDGTGTGTIIDDLHASAYGRTPDDDCTTEAAIRAWRDELVLAEPNPTHCIRFDTQPFATDMRLGGTPVVSFSASFDSPTAILSVMLVDVGAHPRLTGDQEPTGRTLQCGLHGPAVELQRFVREPSPYRVLARGWMNAQNYAGAWVKHVLEPGRTYRYDIELEPFEQTIMAGDHLRLIIFGTDPEATVTPHTVRRITIDPRTVMIRERASH